MSSLGRTAILIPSLGRAQYVKRTVGNIESNTPEPHDQWWCVAGDEYDEQLASIAHGTDGTDGLQELYWIRDDDDEDRRYVTRMNKLVRHVLDYQNAQKYEFLFFGSDDVTHHPGWLARAIEVMETAENAQVVVVNDLRNPNGTQALIRTSYVPLAVIDDPTKAFHDGYRHNFADTEMFVTAAARGVIYRAMDSHVEHLHPLHRGSAQRPWDETYQGAQSHWNEDVATWEKRHRLIQEHFGAA